MNMLVTSLTYVGPCIIVFKQCKDIQIMDRFVIRAPPDTHEPMEWAATQNGKVVSPAVYTFLTDKPPLQCLICHEEVHFRRSHKRRRNGIDHPVKSHFVHNSSTSHGGESMEHLAAKKALLHADKPIFRRQCVDCRESITIHIDGTPREEVPIDKYRLDIGYINENDELTGAVEVFKTHLIGHEKEQFLTNSGLAWCEVSAHEVLCKLVSQDNAPIHVLNCSMTRCTSCLTTVESERIRAEVHTLKKDARNAMKAKSFVNHWDNAVNMSDMEHYELCEKLSLLLKERFNIDTSTESIEDRLLQPEETLTFGKHCGKHLRQLWENDQESYVRWVAGYTGRRDGKKAQANDSLCMGVNLKLRNNARDYLKGHCLMCFSETGEDWKQWCRHCYKKSTIDDY